MANILPDNEIIEFENQQYTNPQVFLDESLAFIDNLRNIQNQNNAEIATDTYSLGTAIPSNLGGLGGGESYFTSRYQVPQGVALANNLRATAQAAALNEVLQNEQSMMKQRYSNAQKAARQRAAARARARASYGSGGGEVIPTSTNTGGGDVSVTPTDKTYAMGELTIDETDINRGGKYIQSMDFNEYGGHDIIWVTPSGKNVRIPQLSDGSYATGKISDLPGMANMPFLRGK